MLLKIAWRNTWRSRIRSIVVILSIAVGVWALSFILSFTNGITYTYIDNAIRDQWSHLQLHHPEFHEDKDSKHYLAGAENMLQKIRQMPEVAATAARVLTGGMVSSSRGARGVQIIGIEPNAEAQVTHFDQKVVEGEYFKPDRSNEILISRRMAEKLKVKLRSRIVLTFQNLDGDITAAAFRITGLFSTGNMLLDDALVCVEAEDLRIDMATVADTSLGTPVRDITHEVAVFLKNSGDVPRVKQLLVAAFPSALVQDYWELSPDIELYESQINTSNTIVITIFMLALIFGIINTMLMAVLERYKELGMLMAIGMNKAKIFAMIVLETLLLGLVAAPIGLVAGYLTVWSLEDSGLDLSTFAKGLERFGMQTVIYPQTDLNLYFQIAVAVLITALLASLYPARKAVRLKPVEALQKL
jgi:ABC-type lipoprotein release transport system permease subunit